MTEEGLSQIEEIKITAEGGSYLILNEFDINADLVIASASIKGFWYSASVTFEISKERIQDHLNELAELDSGIVKNVLLINESGNFEANFNLDHSTGKCIISGNMLKSLSEEDQLRYEITTDWSSLRKYKTDLEALFPSSYFKTE
jgi:hypothetical protein